MVVLISAFKAKAGVKDRSITLGVAHYSDRGTEEHGTDTDYLK